ncbi:MAG: mechanosensitive ion channel family protein, partial [Candidatus Hadarchaeia archaeon]
LLMGERSVRVGDWVEFKNMYGVVVDTGVRASTVRTLDNRHILIPNSNFVQSPFTNYSHRDPKIRISIKVSVAYGSDVEKVKGILLDIAENNEKVLDLPEPRVVFQEFGNSSLNFELDCWIGDPKFRRGIKSEINFEIDRRFEENGIEIPFPQRDVHLKRGPEVTEEMVEEEEDL